MKKSILMFALFGICFLSGFVFSTMSLVGYSILAFTVSVIFGLFGIYSIISNRSPKQVYESKVRELLNTYDSILLKCGSVPNIDGRNVIKVESMDDLIDAQFEIRKPICYLKQSESCSFMLLDEKEVYVYVEKINDDVVSPVEIEIDNVKYRRKESGKLDSEMLRDIDKTTIIKLSNKRSYKISPIRKNKDNNKKEEKKYATEYLFDVDEIKDIVAANDEVEILDF